MVLSWSRPAPPANSRGRVGFAEEAYMVGGFNLYEKY